MDVLEALLPFLVIVLLVLGAKAVWVNGFVAGTLGEARLWLEGIDKLRKPNWQSLPVTVMADDNPLTPEQTKWMNQIYVSAYELALHTIKAEIAEARREIVEKAKADEERQVRRFGG
jgi:predicted phosphoribosyltransferase